MTKIWTRQRWSRLKSHSDGKPIKGTRNWNETRLVSGNFTSLFFVKNINRVRILLSWKAQDWGQESSEQFGTVDMKKKTSRNQLPVPVNKAAIYSTTRKASTMPCWEEKEGKLMWFAHANAYMSFLHFASKITQHLSGKKLLLAALWNVYTLDLSTFRWIFMEFDVLVLTFKSTDWLLLSQTLIDDNDREQFNHKLYQRWV